MKTLRVLLSIIIAASMVLVLPGCASSNGSSDTRIRCIGDDSLPEINAMIELVGERYENVAIPSGWDLAEYGDRNILYPEDLGVPDGGSQYFVFDFKDDTIASGRNVVNYVVCFWENGFDPAEIMADDFSSVGMDVIDSFYREYGDGAYRLGMYGIKEGNKSIFVQIDESGCTVSGDDLDEGGAGLASGQFDDAKAKAEVGIIAEGRSDPAVNDASGGGSGEISYEECGFAQDAVPWSEARNYAGQTATFQGEVASIAWTDTETGGATFINVGTDYPDPARLTAVIWEEDSNIDLSFFEAPVNMEGKTVQVTGEVYLYGDAANIKIVDPSQIKVASLDYYHTFIVNGGVAGGAYRQDAGAPQDSYEYWAQKQRESNDEYNQWLLETQNERAEEARRMESEEEHRRIFGY